MQINQTLLDRVNSANAQLLVVTKYWNKIETAKIITKLEKESCVLGWGENRIESLKDKQLSRDQTHFIGRLQSRQLKTIVAHCATVQSLASLKHAEKLDSLVEQNNYTSLKIFVQVNVAKDPSKEGLNPDEVESFLVSLSLLKNLEVLGLSSMGWGEFTESEKLEEFKCLIGLKNKFLPAGLTSAGTSRDYTLALQAGIDIVRVGKGIVK